MKTIKIKVINWEQQDFRASQIYQLMSKFYNLEFSEEPDYIIFSTFGRHRNYVKYDKVRIFFGGENFIPDFNLADYAISTFDVKFADRSFYWPICFDEYGHFESLQNKNRNYSDSILKEKKYFCNFIYSHECKNGNRKVFFDKLGRYKHIESVGTYLKNRNDVTVAWEDDSKREFQSKCKFTIAFDSVSTDDFITEKITDAFYADTIPIYWGSKDVANIFNHKAFINCLDYPDFDTVIEKIKELDNDNDKYMAMLRQPIFNDPNYPNKKRQEAEEFVRHIFEQPIEKARRRTDAFSEKGFNEFLKSSYTSRTAPFGSCIKILYYRIKKIITFPYKQSKKLYHKFKNKN